MNAVDAPASVAGLYFDTLVTLTGYCSQKLLKAALALCPEYSAALSRFERDSDVWRLNGANGAPVQVCCDTAEILREALRVYTVSGGAFDVTVGGESGLWSFTDGSKKLPDEAALARAASAVGSGKMRLTDDTVTLAPGQRLDLGGIAKGYIADEVAAFLLDNGAKSVLLDFGGDIVVTAPKPDGTPWRVGLQTPFGEPGKDIWATLDIERGAVVTSGVDRRGFDANGERLHHILDPKTGKSAKTGLLAVTVLSDAAMRADALATALFVLGEADGAALAEREGVGAVFLRENGTALCVGRAAGELTRIK